MPARPWCAISSKCARLGGAAHDQLLDSGDHLGRGVEALLRDLVEQGAVPLVADAGQQRQFELADGARELVVVEPGQVVDGAAAADDDDRVGSVFAAELLQRLEQGQADLGCGTLALETAVDIVEAADPVPLQAPGLGLEVTKAGTALGRDHEHMLVVPGRRELLLAPVQALALQPLADLALPGLEVAERVAGVDRIDLEAEAVLRLEDGSRAHQQLDARPQGGAGGALELGQDARRRRGPDHGVGLGQHLAGGVTLGQLEVDMAVAQPRVDQLDQGPDAGGKGLRDQLRDAGEQLREADAGRLGRDGVA